jgi:signal transduction protein with GAF and PtsI domain
VAIDTESDIQAEFAAIKDTLQKLKLPADLALHESKQGIKREDQQGLQVLAKCARFTETSIKLLSTIKDNSITEDDIKQLCVIQVAQMRYLQDEYASLIVQNKFSKQTSQMFRSLQRSTSGLSPTALQNLKLAADITSTAPAQVSPAQSSYGYSMYSGLQNSRGRGRGGFWRPRNSNYNQYNCRRYNNQGQSEDVFGQFAQRQVPQYNPLNPDN